MKIQCHVCEASEAAVLCCADEAALCAACDEKVHAANKLASKHPRVPLSNSSAHMPKCDICQEMIGYFFCLEDRALLCRKCDVAVHTVNPFVSTHQRFLLTGVKVELEATDPGFSPAPTSPLNLENVSEPETLPLPRKTAPRSHTVHCEAAPAHSAAGDLTLSKRASAMPFFDDFSRIPAVQGGGVTDVTTSRLSFSGGAGSLLPWHMDDFIGLSDFNQNFGYSNHSSSKADNGKLGESDCSSILRSSEDDLDAEEGLGEVPDVGSAVSQISSPPTASGLYWPNSFDPAANNAAFVPEICWNPLQTSSLHRQSSAINKRRRQQFK